MDICWGIVEDINDPAKAQRVQVRIIGYYDDLQKDELPWCQIARSATDPLTFDIGSSSHRLKQGSQVLCVWLDTEYQQPFVLGQVPRISDCQNTTNLDEQVTKTSSGHKIVINDGKNPYIDVTDNMGNNVHLGKEGISIHSNKDSIKGAKGNFDEQIDGNNNITINGNYNITVNGIAKIIGTTIIAEANLIDASKVDVIKLPDSCTSMFTAGPIDTFTGQPNKRSSDGSK